MQNQVARLSDDGMFRVCLLTLLALTALALASLVPQSARAGEPSRTHQQSFYAGEGLRLEADILKSVPKPEERPERLRQLASQALKTNDIPEARKLYRQAIVADPESVLAWIGLSDAAARSTSDNWQERSQFQREARGSASRALSLATNERERAAALARLGAAFELTRDYRAALDAYRESLENQENLGIRQTYAALRTQWGFRVADYSVDSDAAQPRVCFQFSEPLDRTVRDFTPYIVAGGANDVAVSSTEREICISGLEHGQSYDFVLRAGLPSDIDEPLEAAADYAIYVRDRSPSARFTGRNYVLPRTGQTGVPVVSVNASELAIEIFRIPERALVEHVRADRFLEQLQGYVLEDFENEAANRIWSGTMQTENTRNADVTTSIPVLEAVGRLEPGVYVMTAGVEGAEKDSWEPQATQWFIVSDLGLTALSGNDGIHVLVRSLETAEPVSGATVDLVARNNEVLARATSDVSGNVTFDAGLARGNGALAPGMVAVRTPGGDFGFLDMTSQAFDLTDRGVEGRAAPGALDAFLYTERGVYRPGEFVQVGALLRDARGEAVSNLPLTLVTERPDGVEYARTQLQSNSAGGRTHEVGLLADAQSGTWLVRAYVDPKGDPVGEVRFLVENYVPERIELTLSEPATQPDAGGTAQIGVDAQYLYGAPAEGLTIGGEVVVRPAKAELPGLDGFTYGIDTEEAQPVAGELRTAAQTGEDGTAQVDVNLPTLYVSRPLEADITVRVTESGGRAIARKLTVPLRPRGAVIAVRPVAKADALSPGGTAAFDVALAAPDGTLLQQGQVRWEMLQVERDWQWYHFNGNWRFEPIERTRRIASGEVATTDDAPVRIETSVEWGTHRLVLRNADGTIETAHTFPVGFSTGAPDAPDTMSVSLDRESVDPGERISVRVAPRFAGKVTVAIIGNGVQALRTIDAGPAGASVDFAADEAWGTGAYAVAIAHRGIDVQAQRMPQRAIGLKWFAVGRSARTMNVSLNVPERTRPNTAFSVPVRIAGLDAGERAYVTVAAVDVGILNLTRFESPDPVKHVLGQARLSSEIRDLYGNLIDGMRAPAGVLRSGGDSAPPLLGDSPPDQEPLALFSGIVEVDSAGQANVSFELPAFDGTIRIMAVAWTAKRLGAASAEVVVRDPVVMMLTAPRFLSIDDQSSVSLTVHNLDGAGGAYELDVSSGGAANVDASGIETLALSQGAREQLTLPVTATRAGLASVDVTLTGPAGTFTRAVTIPVAPASPLVERYVVENLQPGGKLTVTSDLVDGLYSDTASVSVSASPLAHTLRGFDPVGLVKALDIYPHACSEQLVSRALPLLSLNALNTGYALGTDAEIAERVDRTVARVLSRQGNSGGFGLWRSGDDNLWLNAFVTDFLTRARERGHDVPSSALTAALDRLRNGLVNGIRYENDEAGIAYAAYVLARNGRPVGNDVRYVADTRIGNFTEPLSQGHIAAALTMFGDETRAARVFDVALDKLEGGADDAARDDFGTRLRDSAAILTLLLESRADRAAIERARGELSRAWEGRTYTSTQEKAWLLAAADKLRSEAAAWTFKVDGSNSTGQLAYTVSADELADAPSEIINTSESPATIALTVAGRPLEPLPESANGYAITRTLYTMDGEQIDQANVRRNDRLVVVVRVTEEEAQAARVLVVDYLPAGFEAENPALVDGASLEGLSWLKRDMDPAHLSFRDDRVVAAFDRSSRQSAFFDVAYIVRAVRPGTYAHPAATVEDMYRPDRYGRTAFTTMTVSE
ncbi:MG2 domain-containing protein [Tepidamorphus sp. 3E244]|uniref:alpha-2-macroglobulin family protein n=1 Tax=Tepidamorphus sp. 3E244 TaxID=3385498 RepID=UPI0038FC17FB